jgi:hypothetical protein
MPNLRYSRLSYGPINSTTRSERTVRQCESPAG